jgi:hypothetical protein
MHGTNIKVLCMMFRSPAYTNRSVWIEEDFVLGVRLLKVIKDNKEDGER